jgi:hypothetical protein
MGEEGLWGAYAEHAQRELAQECPDHNANAPWNFTTSPEWQRVEQAHYLR